MTPPSITRDKRTPSSERCEACGHSFIGEDSEHTGNLTHWFGGDGSIWCTFCKEDGSCSACSILVAKLPYARGALTEKDALLAAEKANSKNAWGGQNDLRRRLEFETAKHSEDHQRAETAEAKVGALEVEGEMLRDVLLKREDSLAEAVRLLRAWSSVPAIGGLKPIGAEWKRQVDAFLFRQKKEVP